MTSENWWAWFKDNLIIKLYSSLVNYIQLTVRFPIYKSKMAICHLKVHTNKTIYKNVYTYSEIEKSKSTCTKNICKKNLIVSEHHYAEKNTTRKYLYHIHQWMCTQISISKYSKNPLHIVHHNWNPLNPDIWLGPKGATIVGFNFTSTTF